MPYVSGDERGQWVQVIRIPQTPGQLNYLICSLLNAYVRENGGVSYALLNEVVGVLECVKQEYYRRVAVPYEDLKIRANGDLPWPTIEEAVAQAVAERG